MAPPLKKSHKTKISRICFISSAAEALVGPPLKKKPLALAADALLAPPLKKEPLALAAEALVAPPLKKKQQNEYF